MNNLQTFNILDLGLLAVYLLAAALLCRRFIGLKDFKLQMLPYLIVVIHLFSSIGFYFFVKDGVGDAKGYFLVASSMDFFGQGGYSSTGFIENMLYPFVRYLQFSFFSTFLIFSYISLLGFMMLYDIAVRQLKGVWSPWLYLFLLPSQHLHFPWTLQILLFSFSPLVSGLLIVQ